MARKTNGNGVTPRTRKAKEAETTPVQVVAEPRKNLVPINLEEEIRRRAYEIFVERGSTPGNESEDWLTAEREVRLRYQAERTA
jgi:DUF2934 family protein